MLYPISLNLKGKKALIVGAGRVALRKCKSLIQAEAEVFVVAPEISDPIKELKLADIAERPYQSEDLNEVFIVIACSNQKTVNDAVAQDCRERNILFSCADKATVSDFHSSAHLECADLQISVQTSGKSPGASRAFKNYLADKLPKDLGVFVDFLQTKRHEIKEVYEGEQRLAILKKMSDKQAFVILEDLGLSAAEEYINKVIKNA